MSREDADPDPDADASTGTDTNATTGADADDGNESVQGDAGAARADATNTVAEEGSAVEGTPTAPDERRQLHPRVRLVWVGRAALVAFVLGTVTMAVERLVVPVSPLVGPAVFVALFLLGTALAVLRYRAWCYRLRSDSLYLERGVVTHVRTVVPYVRVQHVDTRRGPVERATGLASVVVYTAGSRGADVTVPGLTPERAEELQTRLKGLAIAAEGEDAV